MNNPLAEADRLARLVPRDEPFTVPAPLFDVLERELACVRIWSEERQCVVDADLRYISPDEPRKHLRFRNRVMLRGD